MICQKTLNYSSALRISVNGWIRKTLENTYFRLH